MKYKLIFLLPLIITLKGIGQDCTEYSKYFSIDSATKQTEHAGVYGGGSIVHYHVFITVKNKKLRYFDSAWAYGNSALILLKIPKNAPEKDKKFMKNNHFEFEFSIPYNTAPTGDMTQLKLVKKPLDCPQELILRYKAKRKVRYIVRTKFTKIITINLP